MKTITNKELKTKLDAGETPVLLDVRERWEYELCHIQGSINISMSDADSLLQELEADEETIVICHHGIRSSQIAGYLENNGFNQVANLQGGIDAWAKTIDKGMQHY